MENKTPLQSKKIVISSHTIESGISKTSGKKWTRVDIISNENGRDIKFSFFPTKIDGSPTKTLEFYKANKSKWDDNALMGIQTEVVVAYSEEPRSFVGKYGKEHQSMNRTIRMFKEPEQADIEKDAYYAGMKPNIKKEPEKEPVVDVEDIDIDDVDDHKIW